MTHLAIDQKEPAWLERTLFIYLFHYGVKLQKSLPLDSERVLAHKFESLDLEFLQNQTIIWTENKNDPTHCDAC